MFFFSQSLGDIFVESAKVDQICPQYIANTLLTTPICSDISWIMVSQYPLRIDEVIWRKAKAKAAMEKITLRKAIEGLLEGWAKGEITILGGNGDNPVIVTDGKA